MPWDRLHQLLDQLRDELATRPTDDETSRAAQAFDENLRALSPVDPVDEQYDTLLEQAQYLEVRFANDHPVAERLIQEVVDILSKLGI